MDWARQSGRGLDFNPTLFSHPLADSGFTLSSYDPGVRRFWIDHCIACREIGASFGKQLGVAAPSNGGLRGITTVSSTPTGAEAKYTDQFGGTSSACPFAAGVAGLILSANPELTAAQVRDVLKRSATRIDPRGRLGEYALRMT